jgi:dTDP-4-dehydrorhamnose 3,5-epimerase
MPLRIHKHPKILTRNSNGNINGFLIPIYNNHDGFIAEENSPKQVYLTVCDAGQIKGPHLHMKRRGFFTCIRGNIRIIVKTVNGYENYFSGEDYEFATIEVPPGTPAAIQNIADEPAYVINLPSPAWHVDDQDEHPVVFDESVFIWQKENK